MIAPHHTPSFTAADLVWPVDPPLPAQCSPPAYADRPSSGCDDPDIIKALEAVTPPSRKHLDLQNDSYLSDITLTMTPDPLTPPPSQQSQCNRDVLASHLLDIDVSDVQLSQSTECDSVLSDNPYNSYMGLYNSVVMEAVTPTPSNAHSVEGVFTAAPWGMQDDTRIVHLQNYNVPSTEVASEPLRKTNATRSSYQSVSPLRMSMSTMSSLTYDRKLGVQGKPVSKKKSKSSSPVPSRFCHICSRTQKSEKIFCSNLFAKKKCRKAVCEPCFNELNWDFEKAKQQQSQWLCPHCRGICHSVPSARCHVYTKTNERRRAARR